MALETAERFAKSTFSSWGIVFEGPVRKSARSKLASVLDVKGAQFPLLTFLRRRLKR